MFFCLCGIMRVLIAAYPQKLPRFLRGFVVFGYRTAHLNRVREIKEFREFRAYRELMEGGVKRLWSMGAERV